MIRIKELREEKNLSQLDVAKGIETSQRNIGRWENGTNEPTSSFILKLANYFNCTVDYLLGREDDFGFIQTTGEDYTSAEKRIISIYRGLSEREKALFDNLVNSFDDKAEIKKSSRA